MNSSTAHLQKVFACLSTRSSWFEVARLQPNELKTHFQLNDHEYQLLGEFLQTQGERVAISAMLGEEKRWRELLVILKNTVAWFGETCLKKQWRPYLQSFGFLQPIPENALHECVQFLQFLPKNQGDLIGDAIIQYDLLQNSALLHQFSESFTASSHSIMDDALIDHPHLAQLNPSLIIHEFAMPVSKIIRHEPVWMKNSIKNQSEIIAFYKSVQHENVRSVRIPPQLISFLELLRHHPILSNAWLQSKMERAQFLLILQKLALAEIIFITETKEVYEQALN